MRRSNSGTRSNAQPDARPVPIGGLLKAVIADLGLESRFGEFQASLGWEKAVGPALAAQSRPIRVRRGRMEVAVPSAVWRTQLSFMKQDIIARLNEVVGEEAIVEIVLVNSRWDSRPGVETHE